MGTLAGIFQAVPLDYFVLGGIVVLFGLDALRSGIGRAAAVAIALPLASLLTTFATKAIPLAGVSAIQNGIGATALFAALFVLAYLLVRRMGLNFLDGGMGQPIQAVLSGFAIAAIFAVIWVQSDVLNTYWQFGPQLQSIFAEQFRLWWLLGSYAALAFARG